MSLPFPIASTQTDAKSPIDQQLMDAIRLDLDYLNTQVSLPSGGSGGITTFRVNGPIYHLRDRLINGAGKKLDGAIVMNASTFTAAKLSLLKGGTLGDLEVDVKRNLIIDHPVVQVTAQYSGATQSIGKLGSPLSTQSVTTATPDISTQQITNVKPSLNIRSIINIGGNNWLYTFTGGTLLDSDYEIGDSILFAGATSTNNNGEKTITQVNFDGLPSVVVVNATGVEQTTVTGTGILSMYSYEYLATVSTEFNAGEPVNFTSHTFAGNNGLKTIYAINSGANNIVCKFAGGQTQGGVAGTAACTRWVYAYAAPLDDTQYIVGESALFASHTSANNNGTYTIVKVNSGGDNLYVINSTGVNQAGAAGNVNTNRWIYNCPSDPITDITVGDFIELAGHTSGGNNGLFEVKFVNRFAGSNIEIFNPAGVLQAGVVGTHVTALKVVWFDTDFSASYLIDFSNVLLEGLKSQGSNLAHEFLVKEINRGGFSNYNIVIYAEYLGLQDGASGRVATEARSIFTVRPKITTGQAGQVRNYKKDTTATFTTDTIPVDSLLTMDIVTIPDGYPETVLMSLS